MYTCKGNKILTHLITWHYRMQILNLYDKHGRVLIYIKGRSLNPKRSKTNISSLGSCDVSLLLFTPLGSKIWNLYTLVQQSALIPLQYWVKAFLLDPLLASLLSYSKTYWAHRTSCKIYIQVRFTQFDMKQNSCHPVLSNSNAKCCSKHDKKQFLKFPIKSRAKNVEDK